MSAASATTTRPTPVRRGGRIIPTHDDVSTRRYFDFLRRFNNLKDCSWFWSDEHKERGRFTNEVMEYFRNHPRERFYEFCDDDNDQKVKRYSRGLYTASQTRLAEHRKALRKRSAVWMTNDSSHDVLMLLVDVDKKTEKTDCHAAARHIIQRYLQGKGYVEQSSGGKGLHIYFFVDLAYVSRAKFKGAIEVMVKKMKGDCALEACHQTLDDVPIYGLPSIWKKDHDGSYHLSYRGNQLKCPFLPRGQEDLEALDTLSQSPLSGHTVISWAEGESFNDSSPPCSHILFAEGESRSRGSISDPKQKMNKVARDLSRELQRPATAIEVLNRYEALGLHTGEDHDGNRWKLAQEAAAYVARTWKPLKGGGFQKRRKELLRLIHAHTTDDGMREQIRKTNRSTYTEEQLAVTLYAIEQSATTHNPRPHHQNTAPNNSIEAMFNTLDMPLGKAEAVRKKLKAMKDLLEMAGLIESLNGGQWAPGKGRTFHLGPNHPNRAQNIIILTSITPSDDPSIQWLN